MRLKIGNVSLEKEGKIQFDLSWDEAWKNNINCDASYIFAKFKKDDDQWKHINLKSQSKNDFNYTDQTPEGFSVGTEKSGAKMGMWIP